MPGELKGTSESEGFSKTIITSQKIKILVFFPTQ